MRPARPFVFAVVLLCLYLPLHARSKQLIVTGKLTELSASGAVPAWAIQLNPVIIVDGRQLSTLEIKTPHPAKLESLQDAFVQAKGMLITAASTGAAAVPVLELSSIHSVKYNNPDKDGAKFSFWSSLANFFSLSPI
jgi:hypothetical protein